MHSVRGFIILAGKFNTSPGLRAAQHERMEAGCCQQEAPRTGDGLLALRVGPVSGCMVAPLARVLASSACVTFTLHKPGNTTPPVKLQDT